MMVAASILLTVKIAEADEYKSEIAGTHSKVDVKAACAKVGGRFWEGRAFAKRGSYGCRIQCGPNQTCATACQRDGKCVSEARSPRLAETNSIDTVLQNGYDSVGEPLK